MRKKYMWWIIGIAGVTLLAAALWGPIVSNVEQPKYQVVESSGNIEIRDYAPMIVGEVDVTGADVMPLGRPSVLSPITSLGITPPHKNCR
jgi:hypothetical protein